MRPNIKVSNLDDKTTSLGLKTRCPLYPSRLDYEAFYEKDYNINKITCKEKSGRQGNLSAFIYKCKFAFVLPEVSQESIASIKNLCLGICVPGKFFL